MLHYYPWQLMNAVLVFMLLPLKLLPDSRTKMKNKTLFLITAVCLIFSSMVVHAKRERIVLCTDRSHWYPFVFINSYKSDGLYVDIIKDAADRMDWRISIRPMDWKKCLRRVESGQVDGVLGASYKKARAEFMHYPVNAGTNKKSPARLSSAEYVVVTSSKNSYVYQGDPKSLPQPIRVPRGYSIADDLRKNGVEVDDKSSRGDEVTLMKLTSSHEGSVVMLRSAAKKFSKSPAFKGKFTIQKKPYKSKDYYLAFSKQSGMDQAKRDALWQAVGAVTSDEDLIAEYTSKY